MRGSQWKRAQRTPSRPIPAGTRDTVGVRDTNGTQLNLESRSDCWRNGRPQAAINMWACGRVERAAHRHGRRAKEGLARVRAALLVCAACARCWADVEMCERASPFELPRGLVGQPQSACCLAAARFGLLDRTWCRAIVRYESRNGTCRVEMRGSSVVHASLDASLQVPVWRVQRMVAVPVLIRDPSGPSQHRQQLYSLEVWMKA
ncbi:hypothetical protein C7974DRAFT_37063 [Boeremia exigua]|uniref:uncharacterized protein n=1 Tax=Boeremia exigua TaxID=749465 RepID=UPI001E8D6B9D|nr:uncharacterized protein C7974DRAFT_37063 [Boeremia exigua]KAH6618780.1 hypothetical protein C7974DRAFT_37063 [Boeremia exigua]